MANAATIAAKCIRRKLASLNLSLDEPIIKVTAQRKSGNWVVTLNPKLFGLFVVSAFEARLNHKPEPYFLVRFGSNQKKIEVADLWPLLAVPMQIGPISVTFEKGFESLPPVIDIVQSVLIHRSFGIYAGRKPRRSEFQAWLDALADDDSKRLREISGESFDYLPEDVKVINNRYSAGQRGPEEVAVRKAVFIPFLAGTLIMTDIEALEADTLDRILHSPQTEVGGVPKEQWVRRQKQIYLLRRTAREETYKTAHELGILPKKVGDLAVTQVHIDFLPPETMPGFFNRHVFEGPEVDMKDLNPGSAETLVKARAETEGELKGLYCRLGCEHAWRPENFLGTRRYLAFQIGRYIFLDTVTPNNAVYVIRIAGDDEATWQTTAKKYKSQVRQDPVFVARLRHTSSLEHRLATFLAERA